MIYKLMAVACYVLAALGVRGRCAERDRCPVGTDLRMGVRLTGAFECWPTPVPARGQNWSDYLEYDGTYMRPERSVQPGGIRYGWVYCTGGARPVVVDERTVGCMR